MIMVAAMMPLLIGSAAIGLDTIHWAIAKRQLQQMADAAALAGGRALYQKHPLSEAVLKDLQLNNAIDLTAAALIENAPKEGAYIGNTKAVRVVLQATPNVPFASLLMSKSPVIVAEATSLVASDQYCVISLDESKTETGIDFSGGGNSTFNCSFHSNAGGSAAIAIRGGATTVTTPTLSAVGSITGTVSSATIKKINQPLKADPYAYLPEASAYATNCLPALKVGSSSTITISPGCWTGGMSLAGKVTLLPGVYVINGGDFSTSGGDSVIQGTGVTIILTASSSKDIGKVAIAGESNVSLSAPHSGPFAGILMYQDRKATLNTVNGSLISGNSTSKFEGNLYFPKTKLTVSGNSSFNIDCFKLVSFRSAFTGSSVSQNKCPPVPAYGGIGEKVRLVA